MVDRNGWKKPAVVPVILFLALLTAGGVGAATQRDVVTEAEAICGFPLDGQNLATLPADASDQQIQDFACVVLFKTNGAQEVGRGCPADDDGDNGFALYRLRNCDRNEEGLRRKMSSVVLSLEDVLARGKSAKRETAAGYACVYADSALSLQGVDKLVLADGEDLVADAQDIVSALGFECP